MRYRNLLNAFMLSAITLAAANSTVYAQQDTVANYNNTVQNRYTYTPITYQRGASSAEIRMFPNPATSQATIYVNSIKEQDRGELVIYNNRGKVVQRTLVAVGNNDINVASFANGIYNVTIYSKDGAIYKQQLLVSK